MLIVGRGLLYLYSRAGSRVKKDSKDGTSGGGFEYGYK